MSNLAFLQNTLSVVITVLVPTVLAVLFVYALSPRTIARRRLVRWSLILGLSLVAFLACSVFLPVNPVYSEWMFPGWTATPGITRHWLDSPPTAITTR
jgi:hypothetical protein